MRRLILPGNREGERVHLFDQATSRYLLKVLRMKPGDSFEASDESGNRFLCELLAGDPAKAMLRPFEDIGRTSAGSSKGPASCPPLALVQALPKGTKLDTIVRQATEMGVSAIFLVETLRCVARERGASDRSAKLERRRRIVREALQQSGSTTLTKVFPAVLPSELADTLSSEGFGPDSALLLLCHESPDSAESLHELCASKPGPTVVFIGPEGGFDPGETALFVSMGFRPVHFADTILRTETAAVYAIAAVRTILTEKDSWTISK